MKLKNVKIKKRFKFENLGLILFIVSFILAFSSMYLFTSQDFLLSNGLAKFSLSLFVLSWLMITYGQHAKNHKKIIISVVKSEDYQTKRSY
ncbi:hypothetical protein GHI93_00535 [Lactococcus hircilactis]|uniref:Uncharacterized protein n=1 Tax=Lactococcus hircilactis TaxID=1494462 RepID=A0A7X2CZR3_9LACT|nr:hypothetical protein [Lactococcus hircilactis]MQW38436.1 hypothetical protein [Lactococcus hircilactis]